MEAQASLHRFDNEASARPAENDSAEPRGIAMQEPNGTHPRQSDIKAAQVPCTQCKDADDSRLFSSVGATSRFQ
eukprot:858843-Pleurochrysis_carterae.AAC.2